MGTKNIAILEEAYQRLKALKRLGEKHFAGIPELKVEAHQPGPRHV